MISYKASQSISCMERTTLHLAHAVHASRQVCSMPRSVIFQQQSWLLMCRVLHHHGNSPCIISSDGQDSFRGRMPVVDQSLLKYYGVLWCHTINFTSWVWFIGPYLLSFRLAYCFLYRWRCTLLFITDPLPLRIMPMACGITLIVLCELFMQEYVMGGLVQSNTGTLVACRWGWQLQKVARFITLRK